MYSVLGEKRSSAEAYETLDWIESLPDNWDDEGSPSFPKHLVQRARRVLAELDSIPFIAPTGRESIQMEYESAERGYLEFELFADGRVKRFSRDVQHNSSTEYIDDHSIKKDVKAFYEPIIRVI